MSVGNLRPKHLILGALVCIAVVAACATRDSKTINKAESSVLTIQPVNSLVQGGYCFVPEGADLEDCQSKNLVRQDNILKYVPTANISQHSLNPSSDGNSYEYSLDWDFNLPEGFKREENGVSWHLLEDPEANPAPTMTSVPTFTKNLRIIRSFPASAARHWVVRRLAPGRRHVFYLEGTVFWGRASDRLVVVAAMLHLRVIVDLRGATLPSAH